MLRTVWLKEARGAQELGTLVKHGLKGASRHVLAMVWDGVRFLELWGRRRNFPDSKRLAEKVGLNMLGAPKTRKGLLKHAWRSQNLKRLA